MCWTRAGISGAACDETQRTPFHPSRAVHSGRIFHQEVLRARSTHGAGQPKVLIIAQDSAKTSSRSSTRAALFLGIFEYASYSILKGRLLLRARSPAADVPSNETAPNRSTKAGVPRGYERGGGGPVARVPRGLVSIPRPRDPHKPPDRRNGPSSIIFNTRRSTPWPDDERRNF